MPVQTLSRTPLGAPGVVLVQSAPAAPARRQPAFWTRRTEGVPTLAVTVQDVWPPRVLVSVTNLSVGDTVTLYRVVGSERTPVRGAIGVVLTDIVLVAIDAELPFGVPIRYVIIGSDGAEYGLDAPVTVALPGGKVALSDAIGGSAAEVVVTAWPEKRRERRNSVFQVGGRNVVVLGDRGGFTGQLTLYTETDVTRENLNSLLDSATSGVLQVRQPGGYADVDCYVAVTGDAQQRFSQDGSDERRLFVLDVVETNSWAPALTAATYTYADLSAAYAGAATYLDLATDYATYLDLALGDFGP